MNTTMIEAVTSKLKDYKWDVISQDGNILTASMDHLKNSIKVLCSEATGTSFGKGLSWEPPNPLPEYHVLALFDGNRVMIIDEDHLVQVDEYLDYISPEQKEERRIICQSMVDAGEITPAQALSLAA